MKDTRRTLFALCIVSVMPLALVGCPKKDVPVTDAAPAPTPLPLPSATETQLTTLDDDAGDADAADAGKPKWTGPSLNANQIRAKQCCDALRKQAKSMGNSPESMNLNNAAAFCDQAAMSLGPTTGAQAPELAPMRAMLQGKPMPPICQGL